MSLTNSLKWLTFSALPSLLRSYFRVLQLFCAAALLSELDDFDNLAGWDDFTAHVFDKFAEVVDFDNFAGFDAFAAQLPDL